MKTFKVSNIFWDFDKPQPKHPQSVKSCAYRNLHTSYLVQTDDEDSVIDEVSDLTGYCIYAAEVTEIDNSVFDKIQTEQNNLMNELPGQ